LNANGTVFASLAKSAYPVSETTSYDFVTLEIQVAVELQIQKGKEVLVTLETNALSRFKTLAAIPEDCQLERRMVQEQLCLFVDCPDPDTADNLWRNPYKLAVPLKTLGLAQKCVITYRGRVWHPAFRDQM